ncbi:MAG: anthranilate phosphoribosyltransferase [Planctomycetes bacterium]|nr:anthranilate phosphoribosyltransferase [Planctomycetota bacterium]
MSTQHLPHALSVVLRGGTLSRLETHAVFAELLHGGFDPAQLAGLLGGLAARGETPDEIAGAADALRAAMKPFVHGHPDAIDTCGTGGDGLSTFNLSTAAAIVAAACGARVIKHGNRSSSSQCGSADLLEVAGLPLELAPEKARALLDEVGITFLFAPAYHPALRHAAAVRKALGTRTLFNYLGPLCNPGRVRRQVVGVPQHGRIESTAKALEQLGHERGFVVHGAGGADELTLAGENHVRAVGEQAYERLDAQSLALDAAPVRALAGGDPNTNLAILHSVLDGRASANADAVALNTAAALLVAGRAKDARAALDLARGALANGAAKHTFQRWIARAREIA